MKKWILILVVVLAIVGLADSAYLSAVHVQDTAPVGCDPEAQGLSDCNAVLSSKYSEVAGIPTALGGVVYYLVVLALGASLITNENRKTKKLLFTTVSIGLLGSVWFVYLQLVVINAICMYCMVSAGATTLLFILSAYLLKKE